MREPGAGEGRSAAMWVAFRAFDSTTAEAWGPHGWLRSRTLAASILSRTSFPSLAVANCLCKSTELRGAMKSNFLKYSWSSYTQGGGGWKGPP